METSGSLSTLENGSSTSGSSTQEGKSPLPATSLGQIDDDRDDSDAEEQVEYPTKWVKWAIVMALLLGEFLVALDLTIVATAIPRITDEFQTIQDVGWYGSAFFLTFAAYQSAWGKVYKYFHMKYAFFASVVVFALGTLVCALAPGSSALIIGRAVAGVGAAGITNGVYTIIACIVPPRQVAMYLAFVGLDFSIASVAGPLLGGVLTEELSWRWCFWIALPIAGGSCAIVLLFFKAPRSMKATYETPLEKLLQMDIQGTVLIVASLVCYMLALQYGGVIMSWSSATVIGLLIGSFALAVAFIADQWWQKDRAQIVGRIMLDRTILGLCLFITFLNGTIFLLMQYLPLYFQSIFDMSPSASGIRLLPLIMGMSVALLASSAIVTKIGYFHPLLFTGGILLTVGSGLISTLSANSPSVQYIGYQVIVGVGNGICSQIPLIVSIAFAKPEDIAITTALVLFYQLVSGAISVSLAQSLFTNILLRTLPRYAPSVEPIRVIEIGASELRLHFSPQELPGILDAYMAGLTAVFRCAIALSGMSLIAAMIPRWRSIHQNMKSS